MKIPSDYILCHPMYAYIHIENHWDMLRCETNHRPTSKPAVAGRSDFPVAVEPGLGIAGMQRV